MIVKYKISRDICDDSGAFYPAIHKVEVTRVSGASVFIQHRFSDGSTTELRHKAMSDEREYHDTWEAAKAALEARAERDLAKAEAVLERARARLANTVALVPFDSALVCRECGKAMAINAVGVSRHIDEDGCEDYVANSDHVAVADTGSEI